MDIRNLIFQTLVIGLAVLAFQRTERKRRWLVALLFTLPLIYLLWRISIFNAHLREYLIGLGSALALNLIYWLAFGRTHPPGYQGEITVIGQEDQ